LAGVPSDVVIRIHPPVETQNRNENLVWREVRVRGREEGREGGKRKTEGGRGSREGMIGMK
jgi:hypothetical protein